MRLCRDDGYSNTSEACPFGSKFCFPEFRVDHLCSVCKRGTMRRSTRHGVKERLMWSLLGYYPWRCRMCKHRELLHDRGSEADLAMRQSSTASSRPEF